MKTRSASIMTAAALAGAMLAVAQSEQTTPKSSDGWPLVVVAKPVHLGDQVMKVFEHARPDGTELRKTFILDEKPIPLRAYVELSVVGLLPKGDARVRKGWYQTTLAINGKQVGVINELIQGKDETPEIRRLSQVVEHQFLRPGTNTLHIKAGAQGGNYNDFEIKQLLIHRIEPRF